MMHLFLAFLEQLASSSIHSIVPVLRNCASRQFWFNRCTWCT